MLCLLGLLTVISSAGHGISTHAVFPPVFSCTSFTNPYLFQLNLRCFLSHDTADLRIRVAVNDSPPESTRRRRLAR